MMYRLHVQTSREYPHQITLDAVVECCECLALEKARLAREVPLADLLHVAHLRDEEEEEGGAHVRYERECRRLC